MKKLLLLSALLIFACSSDSEGNPCIYEPTLSTEAVTDITETSATLNGIIAIVSENCDVPNNAEQGFVYSTEIQPTLEDIQVNVNGTNISTTIEGLTPNTTYYVRSFLTNNLGDFYGNEMEFTTTEEVCDVVYLDDNGVTVKAYPCANIGDVGTINGLQYTVVDREMLEQMLLNDDDVTKACTTRVTDMYQLVSFMSQSFNQPIGNWDTSNVEDMESVFFDRMFNQDISQWDVSSVTTMRGMFYQAEFNQPIGSWDTSSVTDMGEMFSHSSFNQPIGSWDTSSVTDMKGMFAYSSFNQNISNWDVSSVNEMLYMFQNAQAFNQDIGSWDVSSVENMTLMFNNASIFNQDLSLWNVEGVLNCGNFSTYTPQWTLPQPNFTNCNPN